MAQSDHPSDNPTKTGLPRGIVARLVVCFLITVSILLLVGLLTFPGKAYWVVVYEGTRAYEWWPFAVSTLAVLLWATGLWHWRLTGLGLHLNAAAVVIPWALFIGCFWLLNGTAMDWPPWFCIPAWLALVLSANCSMRSWYAYSECWRTSTGASKEVVDLVRRDLRNGRLAKESASEDRPLWGSMHCLDVIQGEFDADLVPLLGTLSRRPESTPGYQRELADGMAAWNRTADGLVNYLQLRWPDAVLSRGILQPGWRMTEIRRLQISLAIWEYQAGGRRTNPKSQVDMLIGTEDQHPTAFNSVFPHEYESCREFLVRLFHLELSSSEAAPSPAWISDMCELFERIPGQAATDPGLPLRTICVNAWLGLGRSIPDIVACDVYQWMSRQGSPIPAPGIDIGPVGDPIGLIAAHRLQDLYVNNASALPVSAGRFLGQRAAGLHERSVAIPRSELRNLMEVDGLARTSEVPA